MTTSHASRSAASKTPHIVFTLAAVDDLRRIGPSAVPLVLKKIALLETDPFAGLPLGDQLTGFRKLVVGRNTWRIVYRVLESEIEVCEVWAIGLRHDGEVYAEASGRVTQSVNPEIVTLAGVLERLGRVAGIEAPAEPMRTPVPDWLAERLVRTAGLEPHVIAAMDADQAMDAWTAFCSAPGP